MTFSALSYLVWYRTYRRHIKTLIDNDDYSDALTMLDNLMAEHQANIPNDHSVSHDEFLLMKHARKHVNAGLNINSPEIDKQRVKNILLHEAQQSS